MKSDRQKERAALLRTYLLRSSGIVACCLIMACVASVRTAAAQQSLPIEQASRGEQPIFSESGLATWYGGRHVGRKTASGEYFDARALTAAHRTLPFGTVVRVTDLESGRAVKVRINDRGPYAHVRRRAIIDLSKTAAVALGMAREGVSRIRIEAFASDQLGV
jgi:peptidoglycan lytic transglycosylase